MNILIVTWRSLDHPRAGGSEVWATRVAEDLAQRGHAVTYFSAQHQNIEHRDVKGVKYEYGGERFHRLPSIQRQRFWGLTQLVL